MVFPIAIAVPTIVVGTGLAAAAITFFTCKKKSLTMCHCFTSEHKERTSIGTIDITHADGTTIHMTNVRASAIFNTSNMDASREVTEEHGSSRAAETAASSLNSSSPLSSIVSGAVSWMAKRFRSDSSDNNIDTSDNLAPTLTRETQRTQWKQPRHSIENDDSIRQGDNPSLNSDIIAAEVTEEASLPDISAQSLSEYFVSAQEDYEHSQDENEHSQDDNDHGHRVVGRRPRSETDARAYHPEIYGMDAITESDT